MSKKTDGQDRGSYRGIYETLLDDADYQNLPERARHLLIALKITRLSNFASIYILDRGGIITLSEQTGMPVSAVQGNLKVLEDTHWIAYQYPIVWVLNGLKYDPGISLNNGKQMTGVANLLKKLPKLQIVHNFCDYYKLAYPFDTPPIPIRYPSDTHSIQGIEGKGIEGIEGIEGKKDSANSGGSPSVQFWMAQYREKIGEEYKFFKKDGVSIAAIVKAVGEEEFKKLATWLLTTTEKWYCDNRTPSILFSKINEIQALAKKPATVAAHSGGVQPTPGKYANFGIGKGKS